MSIQKQHSSPRRAMHWGMGICCAVMFVPLGLFFLRGGSFSGLQESLGVLTPIVLCLAVHGLMFLVLGKSCHGTASKEKDPGPTDTRPLAPDA